MKPNDAFQEIGDLMNVICPKFFREEPLTAEEWDKIGDAVLLLAQREKEKLWKKEN